MTTQNNFKLGTLNVHMTTTFLNGDDYGSASELVVMRFTLNYHKRNYTKISHDVKIDVLREVIDSVRYIIEDRSYDTHTGFGYDCTGRAFGSRWEKLHYDSTYDGIAVVFKHSYAYDI